MITFWNLWHPRLDPVPLSELPEDLHGRFSGRRKIYRTTTLIDCVHDGYKWRILPGFYTDLQTLPMGPISVRLANEWGLELAAIFHDAFYRGLLRVPEGIPTSRARRRWADKMLRDLALAYIEPPPRWKAWATYLGVRIGGWASWNEKNMTSPNPEVATQAHLPDYKAIGGA